MKTGVTISCIGHALAIGCALVAISAQPMEVPPVDSLPVQFISEKDFTKLTQGVKNAPQLKIEMPKPLADKVDAPKAVDQLAPKVADKPEIKTELEQSELRSRSSTSSLIRSRRRSPTSNQIRSPTPSRRRSPISRRRRNTSRTRSPIC